jgi:hypothetical protein
MAMTSASVVRLTPRERRQLRRSYQRGQQRLARTERTNRTKTVIAIVVITAMMWAAAAVARHQINHIAAASTVSNNPLAVYANATQKLDQQIEQAEQ